MRPLWWITHILLSLPTHLHVVGSLKCDLATQYLWPPQTKSICCDMCPPGEHMLKRCSDDLPTICVPCSSGYYMNNYNFQRDCISCQGCSKSELEKVSTCTTKQDDVCKCKTGYRCKDTGPCRECEKMPTTTTTKHTKLPNTTSTAVPRTPNPTTRPVTPSGSTPITNPVPTEDRKWIPMFVTAMCLCLLLICMFAVSKLQSILSWIGSRNNFWSPPQKSLAIQSPEEEEVPMPVQEECGKLELLLDV